MAEKERARLVQAQETIRLRDEFLSIASHELRTPLTAIRLELSALARRLADTDARTAAKLARLNNGSDRLVNLVEALLDVSRISTGQLVLSAERVDLVKIVHDAVDHLREPARRANCPITVTIADDAAQLVGTWDPLRLEQVITNLIGNAIKYAANAPITITVSRDDGNAVMAVDDHGRGVAPGDLDRIFGRFERAAPSTHFGGLGLGLYVAQQIINGHGGTIRAANRAGGGASFVVTLPLAVR
jgi:signal transduction histidine kinase